MTAYRIVGQTSGTLVDGRQVLYHTIATARKYGVVRIVFEADGSLSKDAHMDLGNVRAAVSKVIELKTADGTLRNAANAIQPR